MRALIIFLSVLFFSTLLQSQNIVSKGKIFKGVCAYAKSEPLRDIKPIPPHKYSYEHKEFDHHQAGLNATPVKDNAIVQNTHVDIVLNDPIVMLNNFEGVHNVNNLPNPDTEGDVGLNHYMQIVKSSFGIWDKSGNLLYGPADNKTIWSSIIGPWHYNEWTDPVVIYDPIADRWIASAMVHNLYVEYWEMIAVSATPDPLGEWHCYALNFSEMPDYPKLGVWSDGYYLTFNHVEIVSGNSPFTGLGLIVFNREDMINGIPDPAIVYFRLDAPNQDILSDPSTFLPADLDGPLPPEDTPNFLTTIKDDAWGFEYDFIWLWKCEIDWDDTTNCTLEEVAKIETEPFDANWDLGAGWIHMPNTTTKLHGLGHFPMYRLQYRNFTTYQTLMFNHTINTLNEHAGVRWYELRSNGIAWDIHQYGTYAPDGDSRWMASIAMDKDGNVGLGYSVSSDQTFPSIRVSGRLYNDVNGAISFPEAEVVTGGGNQVYNVRWGDYSMMAVDPADDLTFWYTQEYLPSTAWNAWKTRIVSFQLHKNLSPEPDSIVFMTYNECEEGKSVYWKNNSSYPVTIQSIEQQGNFTGGAEWYIDPWNINLPMTLQAGEEINLNIKVDFVTDPANGFAIDTLDIITDYTTHQLPLLLNDELLVHISENQNRIHPPEVKIMPNPFSGQTTLLIEMISKGMLSVELYDISSIKIRDIHKAALTEQGIYRFDLGNQLAPGTYLIMIRFNGQSIYRKLIKI